MKIVWPYFLILFPHHVLIWDSVPSGSVGSSLHPKQSCRSYRSTSCRRGSTMSKLKSQAKCPQTPEGRARAGDPLTETKCGPWSSLEKGKGPPSGLEGGSHGTPQRGCAHSHKSRTRGLSPPAHGWEAWGKAGARARRSMAACGGNGMSWPVWNSPLGFWGLAALESPNAQTTHMCSTHTRAPTDWQCAGSIQSWRRGGNQNSMKWLLRILHAERKYPISPCFYISQPLKSYTLFKCKVKSIS